MKEQLCIGLIMQGGRTWAGGAEYIKNIILALASLPVETQSKFRVKLICSQHTEPELLNQLSPIVESIHYLEKEQAPLSFRNRAGWKMQKILLGEENPRFDAFLSRLGVDFVYPYFAAGVKRHSFRACPWIPDLQHKYLTQFFSEKEIKSRNKNFGRLARLSRTMVLSSKTAEADFHKFFPDSNCKTEVLQFRSVLSPEHFKIEAASVQDRYYLPERFFIVSNQFWQHKNHKLIFEALKLLHAQSIYPIVVCTGHVYDPLCPQHIDEIFQAIHTYGLAKQVYLLGMIPKLDQIQLLRKSTAVIQPSLFEGWSSVVEDARCFGKPIILSDFPVHVEQNPPDSYIFDRHSAESLAGVIAEKWQILKPGPDLEREAYIQTKNSEEVKSFGRRFLEIAHSAGD